MIESMNRKDKQKSLAIGIDVGYLVTQGLKTPLWSGFWRAKEGE